MAINRFSPIQGLPEWQPQIPLDILVKGLTYKQELFDKNKALLESNVAIGKSVADRILNDEAKKYTQDKINSYKGYLNNNLAYADLTDDGVMKSADTKLLDVTNDMNIVNWVSKSGATSKEISRIDELKKKGDVRYDQLHENSFLLDVNAMKTAKMDQGLNMPTPAYTDFYDADKEKQELIKNFKPNHIKYSQVLPGGYMKDVEDASVYQEQLQAYLEANLSDKAKRELAFRGEYEYKGGFLYEKDDTRKSNYLTNITNQYIGAIDASIKASNTHILGLEQQKFKLDPKDKDFDRLNKTIDAEIEKYKTLISNQEANKATFLASPDKYVKDISQNLYVNKYVSNAAKGNVRIDKSETLRDNATYWNTLNYNQDIEEFKYKKQKDAIDQQIELFKAGAQIDPKTGKLVAANMDAFGIGGINADLPGMRNVGSEILDPKKDGPLNFITAVEEKAVLAKEQIYNQYYRTWEKEAAGANGFFTPEQKANWNALDAKEKKDYFIETVLSTYYKRMENNSTTMTLPDGQKVTRDASYVPNWFKQMRNDPAYRASYVALGMANSVHAKIAEKFNDQVGKFESPTGKKLTPFELAQMSELQYFIEEEGNINDAYTLQNLLTNIDNYISSSGANTGEGFVDWMRSILPGTNFSVEEINALSKKFGGRDNLKRVVENLLHNTNQGQDLVAFGGQALTRASEYAPGGAATGAALGLVGGPFAPVTSGAGALIGGAVTGTAGFLYGLGEEILGRSTGTGFEGLSDDLHEAIINTYNSMTVNQPEFRVTSYETKFYKESQNPQALAIASAALRIKGINGYTLTPNDFQFEGITAGGEMIITYLKGGLDDEAYKKTEQTLNRISESSGGIATYNGEANTFKVKVDPNTLGILKGFTDLYHARTLVNNGLVTSLPKRDYYAKDPKTGATKVYTYQFGINRDGQTELYFYRDNKKITIPRITEAEANVAGVSATSEILDGADPVGSDALFLQTLQTADMIPGNVYTKLDKLLNYAENN